MDASRQNSGARGDIGQVAAQWLARQDRGLTPTEQDEYLQWLRQDPRHGESLARMRKTWGALDALHQWRPAHSTQPNPDLLARRRPRRLRWRLISALGLAAAITLGFFLFSANSNGPASPRGIRVIPKPEEIVLVDGSVVELNQGGKIETDFTPGERRVRLLRGEAHFKVSKNPLRPFIVDAGGVAVRAVGTAFEVKRDSAGVEVLVTEGKVRVEHPAAAATPTSLVAGEHTLVDTRPHATAPVVTTFSPAEIDRALAWQGVRLEFAELPLSEVVAEFNLRNANQIQIADRETANLRVSGTFAATNVDAFVRLMQLSFSLTAEQRADGTVILHRQQ